MNPNTASKSIKHIFDKYKLQFPQEDVNIQQFKDLLKKCKFYRFLIPFLKTLKPDDESDENVEDEYKNFKNYQLYDVLLKNLFEQMDINWKKQVDCSTLERGLNAVINLDKFAYSEIIYQRITRNKPDYSTCTLIDFSQFVLLINIELEVFKFEFMTKLLLQEYEVEMPLEKRNELFHWIKTSIIQLWKKIYMKVAQEYAFLINKSSNIQFISKKSFVDRFYDPCVMTYMSKFSEQLVSNFHQTYLERMKKIADIYL